MHSIKGFLKTSVHPATIKSILYPHLQSIRRPSLFRISSPLDWTQQECKYRRQELEKLRDDRAEILGELTELRESIDALLSISDEGNEVPIVDKVAWIMLRISSTLLQSESSGKLSSLDFAGPIQLPQLSDNVASSSLQSIHSITVLHNQQLSALSRPHRLVLLWPKILFLPPAALWLARYVYASRESLWQSIDDIRETLIGFWDGWVVGPIREILNTVRTGGDSGTVIVSKDSLQSDMDV